jgi:hypothetical protein
MQKDNIVKSLIFALLFFLRSSSFGQDEHLVTFSRKPVTETTCIDEIDLIKVSQINSINNMISKPKVDKLIRYLKACSPEYKYIDNYQDKAFNLVVPKYLSYISTGRGDQHFELVLGDAPEIQDRTITFSYDFDDSYKARFLSHDDTGEKKTGEVKLNGKTIYRSINWQGRASGTIFLSNHLEVSYYTKSKKFVPELEEVISKFNW